jgi:ABC-type polysaccharide/polyol phosphate export permease
MMTPTTVFDASKTGWFALSDLMAGLRLRQVWLTFAVMDVRLRYRRSYLGPFWITISTGIMVVAFGYVFGSIFKADLATFVPYIAVGMVAWAYISTTLTEGCSTFTGSASYIRNLSLPLSVYLYRTMARNIFAMLHNIVVIVVVFLIFQPPMNVNWLLCIPGLVLITLNLTWMALLLGIASARYRDVPAAIGNVLAVSYLVTPVIWHADLVSDRSHIIDYNPFYHLIELVRAPLLGQQPTILNYGFTVALLVSGTLLTMYLYKLKSHRLSYWL